MAMGDVARNAQPQPIPLLLPGQTEMRLEHLFQLLLRHPGPLVIHLQHKAFCPVDDAQPRPFAVLDGVVDQVADATTQCQRLARVRRQRLALDGDATIAQVRLGQNLQHLVKVDRLDVFVDVGVLYALQGAFDQQLQLVQVLAELGLQALVLQQFDTQAQAGDWRAQVVGNGAEQLAAFGQVAADSLTHAVERPTNLDHFTAARFSQRRHIGAQRHFPRSPRQPFERPTLPVHQQADEQQQQGCGEHDETDLLPRQAFGLQAGIGFRQQRGDIQPLPLTQTDLRYQHRRVEWFQGQRVMRPGAR